jgi:hypothetical protein
MNEIIERLLNEYNYKCSPKEIEVIKTCCMTVNENDVFQACCNIIESKNKIGKKLFSPGQIKFFLKKEAKQVFPLWFNEITDDSLKNNLLETYNVILEWVTGYSNFINNEILLKLNELNQIDKIPFSIMINYFKTEKQITKEFEILQHLKNNENFKIKCRELYKKNNEIKKILLKNNNIDYNKLEKEIFRFRN